MWAIAIVIAHIVPHGILADFELLEFLDMPNTRREHLDYLADYIAWEIGGSGNENHVN